MTCRKTKTGQAEKEYYHIREEIQIQIKIQYKYTLQADKQYCHLGAKTR